jgi:hypothetical protein
VLREKLSATYELSAAPKKNLFVQSHRLDAAGRVNLQRRLGFLGDDGRDRRSA